MKKGERGGVQSGSRLAEMKASMGKAIDVDLSDEALKHREELKQEGEDAKNRRGWSTKPKRSVSLRWRRWEKRSMLT